MKEEAILIGFSQLGAVFAGLISIFMAFTRKDGKFSPVDSVFVNGLLNQSVSIVVMALLPLALYGFAFVGDDVWRWSAIGVIVTGIAPVLSGGRREASLDVASRKEIGVFHRVQIWVMIVLLSAIYISLALGFGGGDLYVFALALNIALAMTTFTRFAAQRLL